MPKRFQQLSIDDSQTYLQIPERLGKTRETTEMLVYLVILWILDHPSQGNGYGFPFDQRYLYFNERLHVAHYWTTSKTIIQQLMIVIRAFGNFITSFKGLMMIQK